MIGSNALIQLLQYAAPQKGKVMFAALCSVLNKICDIVPEILIGLSIDVIVHQEHSLVSKLGIANPVHQLYFVAALTAFLWVLESIFEYLYAITWRSLAQNIQHDLRLKTYDKIQNLDLAYFEDKTTGGLLSIVQDDINQMEQFLSQGPNEVIQLVVNCLVMGVIFFYLSPMLALIAIVPIPFVVAIAYYFQNKMAALYDKVRDVSGNLASHIAYRLQGIATIKSSNTQKYEFMRLKEESDLYQKVHHDAAGIQSLYIPVVRMGIMVGFIMALLLGGIYALQGIIPINWYAALVFLTQRFLWPFTTITMITDLYEKTLASAKRILGILQTQSTIHDGKKSFTLQAIAGDISFEDVTFQYSNGMQIFNHLSFKIPSKKTIAFVGSTGSGKSTIIKLLLRFYDAQKGAIAIDGHKITEGHVKDVRACIGLVSQEVYLVEGSIANNIAYGNFHASHDEIVQAAKMAQAHEFIIQLDRGYDTLVAEQGKNFSGGQRQRIAIARAILKKSPILIFDEATSAIDNETEAAIQQSIKQLGKDHTIIIIAHRLSTVRNADTIFVLEKGDIIESGNHEDLLKKQGAYANLWNIQLQ